MARRLSRRAKNLTCMRQLAKCGYCARDLCDAFEVDHLNERRYDDRECNLVATCALCHAIKSRHVRLRRDWSAMRQALTNNREDFLFQWRQNPCWDKLPSWLQSRLSPVDARVYAVSLQMPVLDLERFRRPYCRVRYRDK